MFRFFLSLARTLPAIAQTEAIITGTVRDATGAGLPFALITVTKLETGANRKIVADGEGRYAAPVLAIGRYEVSADRTGFGTETKTGIALLGARRSHRRNCDRRRHRSERRIADHGGGDQRWKQPVGGAQSIHL